MIKRKRRILHVTSGLGVGGAETMLFRLVKAMGDHEHAVVTLTEGCDFNFESLGVPVDIINLKKTINPLSAFMKLRRVITEYKPDVIQAWMYHGNLAASLSSMSSIPVVWGIHHSLHDLRNEKLATRFLIKAGAFLSKRGNTRKIVYVSGMSQAHHNAHGYSMEKAVVIPNGFDCVEFSQDAASRHSVRHELGFDEDHVLLGNFGRYHPVKDHGLLLRAFATVANNHPGARLLLAGADIVASNQDLNNLISSLGIKERIVLLGPCSDMPRLYNALDLYVLSSKSESFPNVLGEASACGVPSVTTDVGDASLIVGEYGRVVPTSNVEVMSLAINGMLLLEPQVRRELGTRARQHVLDHFGLSEVARLYDELYDELCTA